MYVLQKHSLKDTQIDRSQEQIDGICRKSKEVWEKSAAERLGRLAPRAGAENTLKRPLHDPIVISRPLKKRQVEKEKQNSPQDYADEGEESLSRKTEHEPD